ncbi:hypothetical protein OAS41_00020 [Candidatus Marinimicrobia bacterium]|nr:hypothetical protein [Candidatus Neomarinimicrobiota bacterium]
MLIYVDIDDTICSSSENLDYTQAKPDYKKIKVINKLYEKGHEIIYWTARGRLTKIDWFDITKKQLDSWGAKYTSLDTKSKPAYDLLICDKALTSISQIDLDEF